MTDQTESKKDWFRMRYEDADQSVTPQPVVGARKVDNTVDQSLHVRILWPALGFPAVITPIKSQSTSLESRRICLLLVSNKRWLSDADVARNLRYVTWKNRRCRTMDPQPGQNSFADVDIEVTTPYIVKDEGLTQLMLLATDEDGASGLLVALAKYLRDFYAKQEMTYLHEVRVSESATAVVAAGQYHLFWVNRNPKDDEQDISDEMRMLLDRYAEPRRRKELADTTLEHVDEFLMNEYEYEYGPWHAPYAASYKNKPGSLRMRQLSAPETRTEILHPLFVLASAPEVVRIGHITDMHVNVRNDTYEHNAANLRIPLAQFNNWNTSFRELYEQARGRCDLIMLTGDLIDYGRGHWGPGAPLDDDRYYQTDRNWFLFYWMLVADDDNRKPVYTILGNHDYRLNPYGPLNAPGAPNMEQFHLSKQDLGAVHGADADKWWPDDPDHPERALLWSKTPIYTTLDSVSWYLLAINPFLDYSFEFPAPLRCLMYDWAREENNFGHHQMYFNVTGIGLPTAKDSLSSQQKMMLEFFLDQRPVAKVLGIHATLIGPAPEWPNKELRNGRVKITPETWLLEPYRLKYQEAGGALHRASGNSWIEFDLVALRYPPEAITRVPAVIEATYGTIMRDRDWLLDKLWKAKIPLALSGHAHRNAVFVLRQGKTDATATANLLEFQWDNTIPNLAQHKGAYPIFVNTTSGGPIGDNWMVLGKHTFVLPGYNEISITKGGVVQEIVGYFISPKELMCKIKSWT